MPTKLTDADAQQRLSTVSGWVIEAGELTRTFTMPSFPASLMFASAVGHLAEAAGHHPDILIKYKDVKLSLVTHDVSGLSDFDFMLAQQINSLPAATPSATSNLASQPPDVTVGTTADADTGTHIPT